ncbi:hypothetical protein AVEN_82776-1 [Araneus ventricosus]|uniref:Uncharacterized protein n=1 Tax=Araneus ventricosus TaxID=182803 RepID=A0A4Y2D9M1_ARAVE|nr:hypothetical protein AVEN_82776-1 [Araneus ventricosus]
MDFNKYNLRQLLELALRFPEIGAVNFNIVYLILKTIIKKQEIECLTPEFNFVYESPSDSTKEKMEDSESSDETDEEKQEKERKMVEMEGEIHKLNETVEQLANRISKLETQRVQKEKKSESASDEEQKPLSEKEQKPTSEKEQKPSSEEEQKPLSEEKKETLFDTEENPVPKVESDFEKKKTELKGKFSWHKDKFLKQKMTEIKKEVESLKESDQKEIWTEMQTLQVSNDYVVKKFDELLQDFDTVMNGYSKLSMQVEELDKIVNKKIKIEDDVDRLKDQIDKLDAYVYPGRKPDQTKPNEEGKFQDEASSAEEADGPQFVRGEVEKPAKMDKKTHFARMVKNLMAMPEEKRAEIRRGSIQPEAKKVKPTTMKKAYEKFIKAAQETRAAKEEGAAEFELKDTEQAEKIDIAQLQGQAEIPSSEVIIQEEEIVTPIRGTVQTFRRVAKAITLLQDMQKTQQEGRLVKAKEMEAFRQLRHREDEDEQQLSAESFESLAPPSQRVSIEHPKSAPGKATLLFGDDKASQELKERIVMYIKSRLEEMEMQFMDKMHTVETSIIKLQDENEVVREELHVLKSRLAVTETNQNKFEGRLTAVEEKAILNDLHIEEMMIAIDKKADRSDVMQGMSKKDMSILEDRMLKINETTLLDIEELRSFLKDYTVKLRDELDEKVSGFDMDCRLEPLAGRLKRLEKMLKEVSLKARVLECQTMGPIEVKRYLHCEDGKRIKPLRRPISNWTSATQSKTPIYDDRFFDEETAEKIEADVQKRLEDAIFRDSKHLIGGAHTKIKVARSN